MKKNHAFTLAEVLITLGIIGVVAAMTLPTLIHKYRTQVNITKIKKFYTVMNQAIRLSEAKNGPINEWFLECGQSSAVTCTSDDVDNWVNTYLAKYMKIVKKKNSIDRNIYYLSDGSAFLVLGNIRDIGYYPNGKTDDYVASFILNGKSMKIVPQQWVNCTEYFDTYCYNWDGTINKVLPYLIDTDKILGIIPSGTANLLASNLGINSIAKALKVIDAQNIKKIDLITVNNKLSALRCGFGYDADVICKTMQFWKNKFGYCSYFIAGIIFALRLKNKNYSLIVNDDEIDINASCLIVANSPNMYKNMFSVAKNSKLDDGLFDVFILKTTNPILFFLEIVKLFLGIKQNSKITQYIQTSSLSIKNNITLGHIDGEKVKFSGNIKFDILSKKIRIFS